jgi:hypothetical protein
MGSKWTRLRRVLLHAFPASRPRTVVLLDVEERVIATYIGDEIAHGVGRLTSYEIIGAVGVRPLLRALNVDVSGRRLAELGSPQKTRQLNRRAERSRSRCPCSCRARAGSAGRSAMSERCGDTFAPVRTRDFVGGSKPT